MSDFVNFLVNLLTENLFLGILVIILLITFTFRLIFWVYDKLMGDRGFLGDITNIIVWIIRKVVKVLIILIIISGIFVTIF